jgi:hypothetical protein
MMMIDIDEPVGLRDFRGTEFSGKANLQVNMNHPKCSHAGATQEGLHVSPA